MRLEGWEKRLWAVIEEARHRPYELGTWDCFKCACEAVKALTGVDRWPDYSGYTTKRDALALLAKQGASFEAAFDKVFGAPRVGVRMARRGDLCCIETLDGEKHLGVCMGRNTAFLAPEGLTELATLDCLCAWRIG